MPGWFQFRTYKAYDPIGQSSLAEKSGSNVTLIDQRVAAAGVFCEPVQASQDHDLAYVARDALIHSNQGRMHLQEKSGSNIADVSVMQDIRLIFQYWDAYSVMYPEFHKPKLTRFWICLARLAGVGGFAGW